jgi:hypothetical protein
MRRLLILEEETVLERMSGLFSKVAESGGFCALEDKLVSVREARLLELG